MESINYYLPVSNAALNITNIEINPMDFANKYYSLPERERESFLQLTLINNSPFAFKSNPLVFEQTLRYLAHKFDISTNEIKLIGSAKTGYSISPPPYFGNAYGPGRDLDFAIVNEILFIDLQAEFYSWRQQYKDGKMAPRNQNEERYWKENSQNCPNALKRGFIDTNKIPSRDLFSRTQLISNSLFLLTRRLNACHSPAISKSSLRVYRDWSAFLKQLKLNTESVLRKVRNAG